MSKLSDQPAFPEDIKEYIKEHYWIVGEDDYDGSRMDYDDYVKDRLALQRAASWGYSLAIERIEGLEKEVNALRQLCEFADIPKLLIEYPHIFKGVPTGKDIEWAKEVIARTNY